MIYVDGVDAELTPIDNGDGTIALKNTDGTFLSRDSGGSLHWASAVGDDEKFKRGNNALVSINRYQKLTVRLYGYTEIA